MCTRIAITIKIYIVTILSRKHNGQNLNLRANATTKPSLAKIHHRSSSVHGRRTTAAAAAADTATRNARAIAVRFFSGSRELVMQETRCRRREKKFNNRSFFFINIYLSPRTSTASTYENINEIYTNAETRDSYAAAAAAADPLPMLQVVPSRSHCRCCCATDNGHRMSTAEDSCQKRA